MCIQSKQGIDGNCYPVYITYICFIFRIGYLVIGTGHFTRNAASFTGQFISVQHSCRNKEHCITIHPDLYGIICHLGHSDDQKRKQSCRQHAKVLSHFCGCINKTQNKGQDRYQLGKHHLLRTTEKTAAYHKRQFHDHIIQGRMNIPCSNRNKSAKGLVTQSHSEQFIIPNIITEAKIYRHSQ